MYIYYFNIISIVVSPCELLLKRIPKYGYISEIVFTSSHCVKKLMNSDFVHSFEDGKELKISSDIQPPTQESRVKVAQWKNGFIKKTSIKSKIGFSFSVTLCLPFKELFFSVTGSQLSQCFAVRN